MKTSQTHRIKKHTCRFLPTPSHVFGFGSFSVAVLFYFIDPSLVVIPLAFFILVCALAPFFPKIGFFLPVISKGKTNTNGVAITFDDGPDPKTTPKLLDLLSKHNTKATFFVTGEKADAYPELIKRIISDGHTVGNHTYSHDTFIMLKSSLHLRNEIEATQKSLIKQGIITFSFRPPVGITNPRLYKLLDMNGLYCVNFNRRARDGGNKWIKGLSKKILKHLKPNDIVMLHDASPKEDRCLSKWLNEIERTLSGITDRGLKVLPLSELIEKPVMKISESQ